MKQPLVRVNFALNGFTSTPESVVICERPLRVLVMVMMIVVVEVQPKEVRLLSTEEVQPCEASLFHKLPCFYFVYSSSMVINKLFSEFHFLDPERLCVRDL